MRICASRRKTGLLRQTIVATRRKRGQMRTRPASPDPGPLQGSLLHAPRSDCRPTHCWAGAASYSIGAEQASACRRRTGSRLRVLRCCCSCPCGPEPQGPPLATPALSRSGRRPDPVITRRPARRRWRQPPLPAPPARRRQHQPGSRPGSAFPSRSGPTRRDGGWRGTTDRYRPGSGGRR